MVKKTDQRRGRPPQWRSSAAVVLTLVSGCAPSCSCEPLRPGKGSEAKSTVAASAPRDAVQPVVKPQDIAARSSSDATVPDNAQTDDVANETTAGVIPSTGETPSPAAPMDPTVLGQVPALNPAAAAPPPAPSARPLTLTGTFPDLERGTTRKQLAQVAQRLETRVARPGGALTTTTRLTAVLPKPGPRQQAGRVIAGPTMAGDKPIAVVARLYHEGAQQIYVKVSDTEQAAFMREPFLRALAGTGDASTGFSHGRIVNGHPAVLRYYPQGSSSQLTALVNERYLIEVRVTGAVDPYAAQETFKTLSLASLK